MGQDEDDFLDDEESDGDSDSDSVDEEGFKTSSNSTRPIDWSRIELLKEKMWLKQQIADYDDWQV